MSSFCIAFAKDYLCEMVFVATALFLGNTYHGHKMAQRTMDND
jgi:hypothetical protein